MSDKFVEKYTVGEDLVKTMQKKDATATVLYDLIGRDSNCDYTQQLIDGLNSEEPLHVYIKNNFGIVTNTSLPQAHRVHLNNDATKKNKTEIAVGLGTTYIFPFSLVRDLVTSRKSINRTAGTINATSFNSAGKFQLGYDFTFTVFDGLHSPGSTHIAPTFTNTRLNLDNKDANYLNVDFVLAFFKPSTPTQNNGTITERRWLCRSVMHPQDIIDQKMMRMSGLVAVPMNTSFQIEVVVTMSGSGFNYGGAAPMIGFFKQTDASEEGDTVVPDTTNYIDFIETEYS